MLENTLRSFVMKTKPLVQLSHTPEAVLSSAEPLFHRFCSESSLMDTPLIKEEPLAKVHTVK